MIKFGFTEEQQIMLNALYDETQDELNNIIASQTFSISHFKDLQWRFETQVCEIYKCL